MYFNGFALQDEAHFFKAYMDGGDYTCSGFSYGAIKALRAALASTRRIDRLQLFSPAFFQNKSEKYRRLQLLGYDKDSGAYIEKFTENCFKPYPPQPLTIGSHSIEELDELLTYVWEVDALRELVRRGVEIEVYLGGEDRISDVEAAYAFFKNFATVTLIKDANHFLQGE